MAVAGPIETIPKEPDAFNQPSGDTKTLLEAAHQHVDDLLISRARFLAPDFGYQLRARENSLGMLREMNQQPQLKAVDRHRLAAYLDTEAIQIHLQVTVSEE